MGNRNSSPPPATAADIQRATMISTANSAASSSIVEQIPIQNTTNTIQKYIKSSIQPCKCPNI